MQPFAILWATVRCTHAYNWQMFSISGSPSSPPSDTIKKNWRSWNFLAPCNLLLNKIQVPFSLQFHLLTYSYVCVLDASMSERSVKAKSFRTKVTAWYTGFLVWLIPYFSSHTTWDLYQILNFNKIILSFPCGVVFDGCTDGVWFHSSVSICGALQIQLVAA